MSLQTLIKDAGPLLKKYATRLESMDIYTFEDLLFHIPFRYDDYSLVSPINKLQAGETVTVIGKITVIKNDYTRQRFKTLQKATLEDETGSIDIVWFNQPYLAKMLHRGDTIAIAGKVGKNANKLQFTAPEYELLTIDPVTGKRSTTLHTARLVPIYHESYGVSSKWLRRQTYKILQENKDYFSEHLPNSIKEKYGFMEYFQTIEQIHFPNSNTHASLARTRLAFEELFFSQIKAMQRRTIWKKQLLGQPFKVAEFKDTLELFTKNLPFTLTAAQQKSIKHIFADMRKKQPMNRLLEGDVGSGKTIVGAISMYLAYLNGYQSVLMAPTEILAQQHHATISKLLEPLGVTVLLQTGSSKGIKNKKDETKNFHILIGTHAVLSNKINFDNLGLVVIDEQQRFGVKQRALIRNKGKNPHFLTMTATPIPRTIALTMYGHLDLSVLDALPKGRKLIKTWFVPSAKRNGAYQWIEKELRETNSQAFIICPFIEESESMTTVKAAAKEFEHLSKNVWPGLKIGLLHGKMKAKEKDEILQKFREKEFDILVATPVVEVGIDIPNATIIVIEAAERFGLSQLHQLRGRVGRGDKQSYCMLFTESRNPQTIERLKAMEKMHIGAELAEFDLRLRGAGDMYGTAQHGQTFFKIATFGDIDLIEKAKIEAEKIVPELDKYPELVKKLNKQTDQEVSPD
ncbi:MAG TPA: ATP-dependent DNA helicase RecG [Candidatus Saccharimonadales bacterium]|nr:ATP-dependent DNA helicase RecG [Candidatus Saccharimonadales bacterium]